MSAAAVLPGSLALYRLVVARAETLAPRVLAFGEIPPDDTSRGVPYLIIDPDPGWDLVGRMDGSVSSRRGRWRVRACGSSREQALLALDAVRACFLDWRPYAAARYGPARETDQDPLAIDRTVPTDIRYVFGLTYEVDD